MKIKDTADAPHSAREGLAEFEEDLYFLAHELQAPLRKISGFAGLLAQHPGADPKTQLYAGRIAEGAERMSVLISALNRYSFAIAQPAEPAAVEVGAAVENVLKGLEPELRQAGGAVLNKAEGRAVADPRKLAAILRELVSNSIKFRGAKRPRVIVSAKRAGKELVISVSDNGIGVKGETGKLFNLFRRLAAGPVPGAGVGLALCRRLAEQCGGRVWLSSKPGKGAVFFLAVPAKGEI